MSTPRNHHYVSQVLSKKFLSDVGRIYKYSKSKKQIASLNSTKNLFSQVDLNTIYDAEGNLDHKSVEDKLNVAFEKDFPKFYKVIVEAVGSNLITGMVYPQSEQITEAASKIVEMGFVGRSRHPMDMLESQDVIFGALLEIANNATEELKNGIVSHIQSLSGITNKLKLDYDILAKAFVDLMGETTYSIMIAPDNHYFLLPDCTAATKRFKVEDDVIDGKTFKNPAMVIGMIFMPINSKILVLAVKAEFCPDQGHGIYHLDGETMLAYNKILFDNAFDEVACQNQKYLQDFKNSFLK